MKPGQVTRVVVSDEDIANGRRENERSCAVALAVKRATGATWAIVQLWDSRVLFGLDAGGGTGWVTSARLPPRMVEWADNFDDGHPVGPTTIQLTHDTAWIL